MKKHIFFLIIILIIASLSLTIIIESVNRNNHSNLVLAEEEQMNNENNQENVIEVAETKENNNILDDENNDQVQIKTEITEKVDQSQIIETQKEEKKSSSTPEIKKVTQPAKTEPKIQESKQETLKVEKPKAELPKQEEPKKIEVPKCSGNTHGVATGNSGKWFSSESEAINHYKSIIKKWGDKWEKFEIDDETYNKNCPYGYEDWSCPYCGKWTINFYYN